MRVHQDVQVLIERNLHQTPVKVVSIRAEGVFDLHGDVVQGPKDGDLHEHEQESPKRLNDPLGEDKWSDKPVHVEEEVTCLRIRERKWYRCNLHRIVEAYHTGGELVERTGQNGRRYVENAYVNLFYD
jgi:hypothetical protein